MSRNLIRLKKKAEKGPFSEASLRWLVFNESTNGLAHFQAVIRIGRRVFIDEDRFDQWIERQRLEPIS